MTPAAQAAIVEGIAQELREQGKEISADELDRAAGMLREREWRPIETAPKDGTRVVLWSAEEGGEVAYWDRGLKGGGTVDEKSPQFWASVGSKRCMSGFPMPSLNNPSHWLPVTRPPQE